MAHRLMPSPDAPPVEWLRWVRRVDIAMIPGGLVVALLIASSGAGFWWAGLIAAAIGAIGAVTVGPAIRRAEGVPAADPATGPARKRRAIRMTAAMFAAMTLVWGVLLYALDGLGAALFVAGLMLVSGALGMWIFVRRF